MSGVSRLIRQAERLRAESFCSRAFRSSYFRRSGTQITDRSRDSIAVIDAVENADEIGGALAQHAFEAEALLGGHDLFGVGRTHGGDLVGKEQARL